MSFKARVYKRKHFKKPGVYKSEYGKTTLHPTRPAKTSVFAKQLNYAEFL